MRKWRNFCVIAIMIALAFDVLAATGFFLIDYFHSYTENVIYENCTIDRVFKIQGKEMLSAKFGGYSFVVENNGYEKNDKINICEKRQTGFFTHMIIQKEWVLSE